MRAKLDLIIPGLFDLPVDVLDSTFLEKDLPAINQFLRYASPIKNNIFELEPILSACMGWKNYPVLPFAQAYVDREARDRHKYLLFRPVHLKADMHNAIVVSIQENQTNTKDIVILIKELSDYFNVDCDIQSIAGGYWLMRLKECDPPRHYPHYLSVVGRKADPYTEQSKAMLPWYKLMNEMQMYLHQHEINQDRLQSGLLTINSLWFWGAGSCLPESVGSVNWFCDDGLLKQFARASGIEVADISRLETASFNQHCLVIDLSVLEAMKTDTESNLLVLLQRIEQKLFKPLLDAVNKQRCSLRLRAGSGFDYALKPASRLKWWCKPKNLLGASQYQADWNDR
jgi:hypothetical protein